MKKRIGLLGGSFDPVHLGHLNLAINLKESCTLDEVLFVPAGLSPFKQQTPPFAAPHHRLEMLRLAIEEIEGFHLLDWELRELGPSYTIDTVRRLSEDTHLELHLLLGDDHLSTFHLWKEVEELAKLAPPLIGTREGGTDIEIPGAQKMRIPIFDISSTIVRSRLAERKYCGHLVPLVVLNYIKQHSLYFFCS